MSKLISFIDAWKSPPVPAGTNGDKNRVTNVNVVEPVHERSVVSSPVSTWLFSDL